MRQIAIPYVRSLLPMADGSVYVTTQHPNTRLGRIDQNGEVTWCSTSIYNRTDWLVRTAAAENHPNVIPGCIVACSPNKSVFCDPVSLRPHAATKKQWPCGGGVLVTRGRRPTLQYATSAGFTAIPLETAFRVDCDKAVSVSGVWASDHTVLVGVTCCTRLRGHAVGMVRFDRQTRRLTSHPITYFDADISPGLFTSQSKAVHSGLYFSHHFLGTDGKWRTQQFLGHPTGSVSQLPPLETSRTWVERLPDGRDVWLLICSDRVGRQPRKSLMIGSTVYDVAPNETVENVHISPDGDTLWLWTKNRLIQLDV